MVVMLFLVSFSAFIGPRATPAAATTEGPLTKLTNSSTGAGLLQDSRFLEGDFSHGPINTYLALAAWSESTGLPANGGVGYGYASLEPSYSVPTAQNVALPPDSSPITGCYQFPGIPACPILDDGYIRTLGNLTSPTAKVLYVYDTSSGTTESIVLHAPEIPPNKCTGYPVVNVLYCTFDGGPYASGAGAVGSAVWLVNSSGGPNPVDAIVTWSGGQWTQLTPNNYTIVTTPCLDSLGNNQTLFFNNQTIDGLVPDTGGDGVAPHVAYAMLNYHYDGIGRTQSGGCYLMQHQTGVTLYEDGKSLPANLGSGYFAPPIGSAAFNIPSCAATVPGCFDGFLAYVGNVLVYSTYTGPVGKTVESTWVTGAGGTYQIPNGATGYITDGTKLMWVSEYLNNPLNSTVTIYDPGRAVVETNGTVVHNVYTLGLFHGTVIPVGIDNNTALWSFSNSTGMYLKAFQLTDAIAFAARALPAVLLTGLAGEVATGESGRLSWDQDLQYDNGLVAWLGYTGADSGPSVYVYNVKAAEAGQPSISILDLSPYGFNGGYSVLGSTFSQGWFFIDGEGAGDTVPQIYTVNVTGLSASGTTSSSTTASSTSTTTTSSAQTTTPTSAPPVTTTTTASGGETSSVSGATTTTQVPPTTTTTTTGATSTPPATGSGTTQDLEIIGVAAVSGIIAAAVALSRKRHHGRGKGPGSRDGPDNGPPSMTVKDESQGFQPVPPPPAAPPSDDPDNPPRIPSEPDEPASPPDEPTPPDEPAPDQPTPPEEPTPAPEEPPPQVHSPYDVPPPYEPPIPEEPGPEGSAPAS